MGIRQHNKGRWPSPGAQKMAVSDPRPSGTGLSTGTPPVWHPADLGSDAVLPLTGGQIWGEAS